MKNYPHSLTQSLSIEPGWVIHFGARDSKETYVIKGFSNADSEIVYCENIYPNQEKWKNKNTEKEFTLEELFGKTEPPYPVFAPNLETLHLELEKEEVPFLDSPPETGIPKKFLDVADKIIKVYQFISDELEKAKGICIRIGKRYKQREHLDKACEIASLLPEVHGEIHKSTYFLYRDLCIKYSCDRIRIAASKRRKSLGKLKVKLAEQNFAAALILKYVAGDGARFSPSYAFERGKEILDRTDDYWIDPEKCEGGKVPADLVDELMNFKIPFESILRNPEKRVLLKKIKRPSLPWFYTYSRWFIHNPKTGEKEIRNRFGDEFYEDEFLIFNKFIKIAQYPLQYVFADHCLLDVFIVDKNGRKTVFRIWITLLIDTWSRCVLGFVLLDEYPSVESIQTALWNAIFRKDQILKKYGLEGKWPCYGIPLSLYLDNAWAHLSLSLENFARAISQSGEFDSIEIVLRPPYMGRYGAIIERYFGVLQARLKKYFIGSYKKSTPQKVRSAKNQACALYEDLYKEILNIIVDYQNSPHSELDGLSPNQKWEQALRLRKPIIPNPSPAITHLFWRSYPDTRQIRNEGISFLGMDYWSKELNEAERFDKRGKAVEYGIKWTNIDISEIAVFRGDIHVCNAKAEQLKLANKDYLHISIAERNLAQEIADSYGESKKEWTSHLDEAQELMSERRREQLRIAKLARQGLLPETEEPEATLSTNPKSSNKFSSIVEEDVYDNLTTSLSAFNRPKGG